ncbi:unnamed protein product, partial [marine sediment metagenome]
MAIDYSWEHSAPSGTEVHFNNIVGNIDGVVSGLWVSSDGGNVPGTISAEQVDATNNWWGDISGPKHVDTNPGGTGNAVSENVEYVPWLTRDFETVFDDNI